MSNSSKRGVSQFRIAGIYAALVAGMLIFLLAITVYADHAQYRLEYMPKIVEVVLDIIKILVGAIIGALTPTALGRAMGPDKNP